MELYEMVDRIMLDPNHPPMDVWVLLSNALVYGKLRSLEETLSFIRESMLSSTSISTTPVSQTIGFSSQSAPEKQGSQTENDNDKVVLLTEAMIRFGDIQVDAPVVHIPSQHVLCWGPGTPIIVSTNA